MTVATDMQAGHVISPAEIDLAFVEQAVAACWHGPESVIPLLQALQAHYRYLPEAALRRASELTGTPPATLVGVSTFYTQFRHHPVGRHIISVCHGTACHVKGAERVTEAIRRHLGLSDGADTDADGLFTVEKVACLGCCTLAPVMQIDGITYGHLTPESVAGVLDDFLTTARDTGQAPAADAVATDGVEIRVGMGSCCIAGGSLAVRQELERALAEQGATASIKPVGCVGICHRTPLVEVAGTDAVLYARVRAEDAAGIVRRHVAPRGWGRRLRQAFSGAIDRLLTDEAWAPITRYGMDVREPAVCAFLGRQVRVATEHSGVLSPLDLDEYLAHEGFQALHTVLERDDPAGVVEAMTQSGLRGRGGAGFRTGEKWGLARAATGTPKYIICNGDEGDPGAFMDRMLLESFPYRILEGIAIAAVTVGAEEGILYIRAEYPLAVERVCEAIRRCEERGLLGDDLSGSGRTVRLRVVEGAGAFVCGEETALIASLEGRRGTPRLRPPYPVERGLHGKPTLVNNVETFALAPWIMRHGAEPFSALGTAGSTGTKVFALAGKVNRGGLIEVPMGITLREIVEEIGGGAPGGKPVKAVQVGGPSGGCIPAALFDTPVDYEALTGVGAIMGSGGLVVIDEDDCVVDLARYFLSFTQDQSCGQCTFCRVGTRRMLEILDRLCTGQGRKDDLERLDTLSRQVQTMSLCGLGQTAPNPVLSTLRHFRDEYEAHLQGRCPAGKCRALVAYRVTARCIGCTLCAQHCPVDAIPIMPYQRHEIDDARCTRCDICRQTCPQGAIVVESAGHAGKG